METRMRKWWHDKVVYQIYPKSFYDTNGDGIGDLQGIIAKLDYLKELGIDMVWISPIYQSPFVDQGYDISDYYGIAPEFGTMEDFDELLAEAKKRGISIVMDLVVNHCSDQHEWFQKALKDPEGKYGDYFYFREGKNGKAPSNYRSYFGGSCWEPVPGTDKYYFHAFAKEQPDLNWENPDMRQELYDMINWWQDKGLAGFRIDAIINIKKNVEFPELEPDGPDGLAGYHLAVEQTSGIGGLLKDLKHNTFEKYDAFTVGEVFNMHEEELPEFIGEDGHFSTIFDFSAHCLTEGERGWYDAPEIDFKEWRKAIVDSQLEVQEIGFKANIIENHDEPRGVSRFLPEYARNEAGTKMLGTVSLLLRGIPFLYQGQEIGMQNCVWESPEEWDDISTKDQYKTAREAGVSEEDALRVCARMSRDNARTPMQWSGGRNAGFTTGTPWMKVNPNCSEINVESQQKEADSVLHYYQELIALRKSEEYKEVFTYGKFEPVYGEQEHVMAFYRSISSSDAGAGNGAQDKDLRAAGSKAAGKRILVAANFGEEAIELPLEYQVEKVLLSNLPENHAGRRLTLAGCGAMVLECGEKAAV